jgi:DNA-binding PadR family transcriptional regulator
MAVPLPRIELHALVALLRLGGDAYAVSIHEDIERVSGSDASIAGIYGALARLERRGLARSSWSEPRPERGGRARRHYRLTASGREFVRRERELAARLWNDVALRPGNAGPDDRA